MPDFRQQVREHYDAQTLPPKAVEDLLARGKAASAGDEPTEGKVIPFPQQRVMRALLAIAATFALLGIAGIFWFQRDPGAVSYARLAPTVVEFFDRKAEVQPAAQDKTELKAWLVAKGAPPEMEIPASLQALESAACQVVDVEGKNAYLSCYWTTNKSDRGLPELVHLLVARADDFRDEPKSAKPVMRELEGWSFASWKKGDVLYTMATAASPQALEPLLAIADEETRVLTLAVNLAGDSL